jgi:hypothetical protein
MQLIKVLFLAAPFVVAATATGPVNATESQNDQARRQRFSHSGTIEEEDGTGYDVPADTAGWVARRPRASEAPAGFDNRTNGYTEQGPSFDTLNEDNVVALRSFNDNRFIFEELETASDGLGPTYNAQSCGECHQNIAAGGASQIAEHRTGRSENGEFYESLGGSLIQSRAIDADMIERVDYEDSIRTFRMSTSTLGAGFVESISNTTLLDIRDRQPTSMRGTAILVPVLEGDGQARIGRFGWKSQHASLTSPLLPDENTSSGRDVSLYDSVPDPEDDGTDIVAFADFMRSTEAPPRGAINGDVRAGADLFAQVGCAVCHVASMTTARPGTTINAGAFAVPAALGSKVIHPYSDFLLHDVGTGDGIPFLPTPEYASTADQIRTAPLWGLRTRNRLMHDGLSFTLQEAIRRHGGQAAGVTKTYNALSESQKAQVFAFLNSL